MAILNSDVGKSLLLFFTLDENNEHHTRELLSLLFNVYLPQARKQKPSRALDSQQKHFPQPWLLSRCFEPGQPHQGYKRGAIIITAKGTLYTFINACT